MTGLKAIFTKMLNIEWLWRLDKITFAEDEGVIRIFIDFARGSEFPCPICGKPSKVYDTTEKEWRHLNFFQYICYLTARVPWRHSLADVSMMPLPNMEKPKGVNE